MLWLISVLLFAVLIVLDRWHRRKELRMYEKLKPDWKCYPLIGHGHYFIGKAEDHMTTIQLCGEETTKLGGIVAAWMGRRLFVIITDPIIGDVVMKSCLQKDKLLDLVNHLTGNGGSLFSRVHIWRPRRKTIAPIFSQKNLYQFVDVFNSQSGIMIEELRKVAGTGPFSVWRYLTSYTMDSVCETTLGLKMHVQQNPNQPFLKAFEEWCDITSTRLCTPWLHLDAIFKLLGYQKRYMKSINYMWDFIIEIIQKKRKYMETKYGDNNNTFLEDKESDLRTVLEILLNPSNAERYTDEWLREEVLVLVLAGTDTSAVGASFVTMMLAKHSDVQERVYQEIVEVIGASNGPITPADLGKLRYLDAVVRESLRLYPPVPAVMRTVEQDLVLPSGVTLVKGCGILMNIWAVNRNPNYWGSDANEFRPERFFESSSSRHPAAFMSFSYGPRGCVGYRYAILSLKTAIANMVRNFRILPENYCKDGPNPPEDIPIRLKFGIMMKDVNNFKIQLEPRN